MSLGIETMYGPDDWPCTLIRYDEMPDILARIDSNDGPRERKAIAAEWGCSVSTLTRATKMYLLSIGRYDPAGYRERKIAAKRESRKRMLARLNAHNAKVQENGRRIVAQRAASIEARERDEHSVWAKRERRERLRDASIAEAGRFH